MPLIQVVGLNEIYILYHVLLSELFYKVYLGLRVKLGILYRYAPKLNSTTFRLSPLIADIKVIEKFRR
jgi:hypothetical protein